MDETVNSMLTKRLVRGGSWATGSRVLSGFVGLMTYALLARLITPETMGAYMLVSSVVAMAVTLSKLGIAPMLVRTIAASMAANRPGKARAVVLSACEVVTISTSITATVVFLVMGEWFGFRLLESKSMAQVAGVAAALVFAEVSQELIGEVFRGFHDIRYASLFNGLLGSTLALPVLALYWLFEVKLILSDVLDVFFIVAVISSVIGGRIVWRNLGGLPVGDEVRNKEILTGSWPLLMTDIVLVVMRFSAIWILATYRSPREVALYGLAERFAILLEKPLLIINSVVPPLVAELHTQKRYAVLERMLRGTAALATLPALVGVLFFAVAGEWSLAKVYGSFYKEASLLLVVLAIGQSFNALAGSCGMTLVMTGHQKVMMIATVLRVSGSVVMALTLVETYGMVAVATVTTIGLIAQNIIMVLAVKRRIGLWTVANLSTKAIRGLRTLDAVGVKA